MKPSQTFPGITLLGLGPGSPDLLTRQAWQVLENSAEIYLRKLPHPAVVGLPGDVRLRSLANHAGPAGSQDASGVDYLADQVLALGRRPEGVVYAVPGHPLLGDAVGREVARRAAEAGLPLQVVPGVSALESTFAALGVSPFPQTSLVDALELAEAHVPSFPPGVPAVIAQLDSPELAAQVQRVLRAVYPAAHTVQLVHLAADGTSQVETLALEALDGSPHFGPGSALYVPPLSRATSFEAFQEVVAHLRAPNGCPWDREQTHESLRSSLLEETYEALDAIDAGDPAGMREEFGDLLLLLLMHAQIAADAGEFTMVDVVEGIYTKIVHRHPHVFGETDARDAETVLKNWERLKAEERAKKGKAEASVLDGIARTLPALTQAEKIQQRAARVGFDWPDIQGVLDKVDEELAEVRAAETGAEQAAELGDLLFAVVNLARWLKVDPESALRDTSRRFRTRFAEIEASARHQGKQVSDLSLDEMEALWQLAKGKE